MKERIRKWRRDRLRDQVIVAGKKLRQARYYRASIDAQLWPDDAAWLDSEIDRLERLHGRLLDKFKEI